MGNDLFSVAGSDHRRLVPHNDNVRRSNVGPSWPWYQRQSSSSGQTTGAGPWWLENTTRRGTDTLMNLSDYNEHCQMLPACFFPPLSDHAHYECRDSCFIYKWNMEFMIACISVGPWLEWKWEKFIPLSSEPSHCFEYQNLCFRCLKFVYM